MKLALVIPVMNHRKETEDCLRSFRETADHWQDIELLIIDNGSTVPTIEWGIEGLSEKNVLRNPINVGVLPALQQGYLATKADYIFYTHNDVTMYEKGWDTRIKAVLEGINAGHEKGIGCAGFYGAKGIGTPDLYQRPYQMHQLIRVENVSDCHRMDAGHGYRAINNRGELWEKITVLDGFSLIVSRKFLDEQEGFDLNLPAHHNYDNHTCLQAMDRGYMNIVISMDAFHHGGVTDVSENWNAPFGQDKAEIHRLAHYPYFYHYWMPNSPQEQHSISLTLPTWV